MAWCLLIFKNVGRLLWSEESDTQRVSMMLWGSPQSTQSQAHSMGHSGYFWMFGFGGDLIRLKKSWIGLLGKASIQSRKQTKQSYIHKTDWEFSKSENTSREKLHSRWIEKPHHISCAKWAGDQERDFTTGAFQLRTQHRDRPPIQSIHCHTGLYCTQVVLEK